MNNLGTTKTGNTATDRRYRLSVWLLRAVKGSIVLIVVALVLTPGPLLQSETGFAEVKGCRQKMEQIDLATLQYSQDNDSSLPRCADWTTAVAPYFPNDETRLADPFRCSAAPSPVLHLFDGSDA